MKEIKIKSSNIKSMFYSEQLNKLYVFFNSNGSLYMYDDVDKDTVKKLENEKEKGKFFLQYIKDKYNFSKLK